MKITNSYYDLGQEFYKETKPENLENPKLISFNKDLAKSLKMNLDYEDEYLADIFSGNKLISGSKPISLAYAGHQFGNFVPQLGDGRAVLIGEIEDENGILQDLQLKGSGRTFFSRGGDGKCPLDAAIREYVVSEAMHFLKIPTTRSLAVLKSDEMIQREMFLPAAVVARVAKGHVRVGTFEYFAHRRDFKSLKSLADYSINRFFQDRQKEDNKYLNFLKSVIESQAELVASWMSIGFIHGVMNTDNTSISGQTIDYGPCAFMDEYDPDRVFSYIDKMGRYSFSNQKKIILWNLAKFAGTILPLIDSDVDNAIKIAEEEINKFPDLFDAIYYEKMAKKIGIFEFNNSDQDKILVDEFLDILQSYKIDFTNGFRILSEVLLEKASFYKTEEKWEKWNKKWIKRLSEQKMVFKVIAEEMDEINPVLIPRNHVIANIIQQAVFQDDFSEFENFLRVIRDPFVKKEGCERFYCAVRDDERVVNTFCGT